MDSDFHRGQHNIKLALVSTKGGVGKTTLSGHIAVEAERHGRGPVGLIDMDPQGSLSQWWNVRARPTPIFATTSIDRAADDLARLTLLGARLTVIDTPPSPFDLIEAAVGLADLVVVPLRPSPHDFRALETTLSVVEPLGKPVVFVLNAATVGARITRDSVALLSRYGPLAPTIVHQRVDYAASMIDGRTAMEIQGSKRAREEMGTLWAFLERCTERPEAMQFPQPSAFSAAIGAEA